MMTLPRIVGQNGLRWLIPVPWCVCVGVLLAGPGWAVASPQGATVVHGTATIEQQGSHTTIQAGNDAIINYTSFDIAPQESVRFVQPSASSRVLNRIADVRPTLIEGRLSANGVVYLVNPAGVYFSGTAMIDVGGIHAAAGTISNEDFLAGVERFTELSGPVVNEGVVRGDRVSLIGNRVGNFGQIDTDGGILTMVAGEQVFLTQHGSRMTVVVDGSNLGDMPAADSAAPATDPSAQPAVENQGVLSATNGQVLLGAGDMYSLAIRNRGRVSASGGRVDLLAASGRVAAGGELSVSVNNGAAGQINVLAPAITSSGRMAADADRGEAGRVSLIGGQQVEMIDGSRLSASGGAGVADGGEVYVNAVRGQTVFDSAAAITAHGGAGGGNGGRVEVSGQEILVAGRVELHGVGGGAPGSLLIDPVGDIHLVNTAVNMGDVEIGTLIGAAGPVTVTAMLDLFVDVDLAFLNLQDVNLNAGRDVWLNAPVSGVSEFVVTADTDNDQSGDIVFNFSAGPLVSSQLNQTYNGRVMLAQDATVSAATAVFMEPIESAPSAARSLTVIGSVDLHRPVGGAVGSVLSDSALGELSVSGAAGFLGATVATVGRQTYGGAVTFNEHTTLQGAVVEFQSFVTNNRMGGVSGEEANVLVSGDAIFRNLVSLGVPRVVPPTTNSVDRLIGDLTVTGSTLIDRAVGSANFITTARDQRYVGPVTLSRNAVLTSLNGDVVFGSTIDASSGVTAGLTVVSERGNIEFGDDIGANTPLDTLTAVSGLPLVSNSIITIRGDGVNPTTIVTTGDIRFNPADRGSVNTIPGLATIAAPDGSVSMTSSGGDFVMGPNNKLTVVGDLMVDLPGAGSTAQVGDLNALGDLTVNASNIVVSLRAGGSLFDANGNTIGDAAGGVDFVASGELVFDGAVSVSGVGSTPAFGSSTAVTSETGGPGGLPIVRNVPLTTTDFVFNNTVLDLTPRLLSLSLSPALEDPADAIPTGPLPFRDRMVREPLLGPAGQAQIQSFAVDLRQMLEDSGRVRSSLSSRIYNDLTPNLHPHPVGHHQPIALNRVSRAVSMEAIRVFRSLFQKESIDLMTGETITEDRRPEIKSMLTLAWESCVDQAGGEPAPSDFRDYLLDRPDHAEAFQCVQQLGLLVRSLRRIGLNSIECDAAIAAVLEPIKPEGLTFQSFYAVISGQDTQPAPAGPVAAR